MRRICTIVAGVMLLVLVPAADAVIIKLVSIKDLLSQSTQIFMAKVEIVHPDRPAMVLTAETDIKGKLVTRRLPVNLKGDTFAAKLKHTPELLKRIGKDVPILIFLEAKENPYIAFAYTEGTWFQMLGHKDKESVRWSFGHCEPYFRRTFKGTTAELREIVEKSIKDNKAPPPPDEKAKPGLGPELKKKEGAAMSRPGAPLFGVIVGLPAGGIIGVLALLFPAVFGGVAVLMRRWAALMAVLFTNSTIFSCYVLWKGDYWWTSENVVWTAILLITVAGAAWAWVRQLRYLDPDCTEPAMPTRTERIMLGILSGVALAGLAALVLLRNATLDDVKVFLWIMGAGFWAGTLYVLIPKSPRFERRALPTEGLVLCCMACAAVLLTARGSGAEVQGERAVASVSAGDGPRGAVLKREVWRYTPEGQSTISSSPVAAGKYVYAGVIHGNAFRAKGRLYCLDRDTGREVWRFDNGGTMKQMYSSPCIADGKVYIGEGFHENNECSLYCLDAATGKLQWAFNTASEEENKLWGFETNSHIESSPFVANGRVYFGAGDKGLYCVDARDGKKHWQYPKPGDRRSGLHIDANPTVVGDRVYCCSGRSQTFARLEVFCVDAGSGAKIWSTAADLPVWGSPTVHEGRVYVGLGDTRVNEKTEAGKGAVLCLDAFDGTRRWRYDLTGAVHTRPACDGKRVFAGSQDGTLYAIDCREGKRLWKKEMGSAVVASPALARGAWSDAPAALYAAAMDGDVYCLDPETGGVWWQYGELQKYKATLLSSPMATVRRTRDGDRRRVYVAASVNDNSNTAVICLEDEWAADAPEEK